MSILAAAPAAPVVISLEALSTAFELLLVGIVIWGMRKVYSQTLGALLEALARGLHAVPLVGGKLSGAINDIDDNVQAALAQGQSWANQGAALAWNELTLVVNYTAETIADLAESTYGALHNLTHATIPGAVHGATRVVRGDIGQLGRKLDALERTLERDLHRRARAIEAELDRDFGIARHGIDAIRTGSLARINHALDLYRGTLTDLNRYVHRGINLRLTRLEKYLGAGVIGGAAVVALTRVFPYWQCTNVRRFNRSLCRSPIGGFEDFLALAFAAETIAHLPEMVKLMQGVMRETAEGLHELAGV